MKKIGRVQKTAIRLISLEAVSQKVNLYILQYLRKENYYDSYVGMEVKGILARKCGCMIVFPWPSWYGILESFIGKISSQVNLSFLSIYGSVRKTTISQ